MTVLMLSLAGMFLGVVVVVVLLCLIALTRLNSDAKNEQRLGQSAFEGALPISPPVAGTLPSNVTPELSLISLEGVQDLLRQNRKIDAIKLYKEQTGVGLRDAKDAVDEIERGYAGQFTPVIQTYRSAADAREDILGLVREGQKIQAIKLYREQTGVGLKAAKEIIDGVAQGAELPPFNPEMMHSRADMTVPLEEICALLRRGQKIHAIKLYRDHTFSSLKDAKDAVEAIERAGL